MEARRRLGSDVPHFRWTASAFERDWTLLEAWWVSIGAASLSVQQQQRVRSGPRLPRLQKERISTGSVLRYGILVLTFGLGSES